MSKVSLIFFAISKFFYNNKTKISSRKFITTSSTINQTSYLHQVILTILFKREKYFPRKTALLCLPDVSKLIDSVISIRQGDQRKHMFIEKKNTP